VAELGALDAEHEQPTAQAAAGSLRTNEQECDLARHEPDEAENPALLLGDEDLPGLDGRAVNVEGSPFKPGLHLGWRVRVGTEIRHRVLVRVEDRSQIIEGGGSDAEIGGQAEWHGELSMVIVFGVCRSASVWHRQLRHAGAQVLDDVVLRRDAFVERVDQVCQALHHLGRTLDHAGLDACGIELGRDEQCPHLVMQVTRQLGAFSATSTSRRSRLICTTR
jgi:hypothetical protein